MCNRYPSPRCMDVKFLMKIALVCVTGNIHHFSARMIAFQKFRIHETEQKKHIEILQTRRNQAVIHCSQKFGDISKWIWSNKKRSIWFFFFLLNKNNRKAKSKTRKLFLFDEKESNASFFFFYRFIFILKYFLIFVSSIATLLGISQAWAVLTRNQSNKVPTDRNSLAASTSYYYNIFIPEWKSSLVQINSFYEFHQDLKYNS